MTRRLYAASVEIDAPPDRVWSVLIDLERYPEWNPFTIAARSTLRVGDPIDMRVRMMRLGVTLEQREIVRELDAPRRMRWNMQLGSPRLLTGDREQRLTPLPGDRTRYVTEDAIDGALAPLVHRLFGSSLDLGFESMARALARECAERSR